MFPSSFLFLCKPDRNERNIWAGTGKTLSGSQYFIFSKGHIVSGELKSAGIPGIPGQSTIFFFSRAFPLEFSASCPTPARPCMISFRLLFPNVVAVQLFCAYVGVGGGTTRKTRVGPGKLLKDVSATLTSCSSRNLEHVESAAIWCATDDGHTWTQPDSFVATLL